MSRLFAAIATLVAASACLEPGLPVLAARDTEPPLLLSTIPAADGGTLDKDTPFEIVFSEPMEPRSIIPGITVLKGMTSVPLLVAAETADPNSDAEFHVTVRPSGPEPTDGGTSPTPASWEGNTQYTLVLSTLLSDTQGNALTEEIRVSFRTAP